MGLLLAAILAAALNSKAAETHRAGFHHDGGYLPPPRPPRSARMPTTSPRRGGSRRCGDVVAIAFALFARLAENLIQATNILASVFYPVVLGVFLTAFFLRRVGGTAVFWATIAAQGTVCVLYFAHVPIAYLWYNVIGCALCMSLSVFFQAFLPPNVPATA